MPSGSDARPTREAIIDLGALRHNVRRLREITGVSELIVVVKADAYGHGAAAIALAAVEAGADRLGVADIREGVALRAAGVTAPVLAWLHGPDADFGAALDAGIELGLSSVAQLDRVIDAAREHGSGVPVVQFKLETGLSRNGAAEADWPELFQAAAAAESAGLVRVDGLFSHVSNTSSADDAAAAVRFERGADLATAAGLTPRSLHLAASAAALGEPTLRYDAVRLGIAAYGLSPFEPTEDAARSAAAFDLRPVMTLRASVAAVRRVEPGTGVSYDYSYRADSSTTLALVPLGYADGVPRSASNAGPVVINGRRYRVSGRIAMDQFVVDVGDDPVEVGDDAVLFGDPATGAPRVEEWAEAAGTINYELVTRIGPRVVRTPRERS
ncbi:alanine racemase [Plantibacter sp. VKM Ac-2880]|uniref:alanine racemase n=1 Tax=Plantibacter sp. VKM Ac-2880 TaxID=2783827 RepID=UPI00189004B8|nr:alanine racemase [Plantibacter sp. VKM Ac-2880]MBF4568381.1 alanine racemase [Plantibacter sp. VKM Ac-2880]